MEYGKSMTCKKCFR